jgi:hypothetical protein
MKSDLSREIEQEYAKKSKDEVLAARQTATQERDEEIDHVSDQRHFNADERHFIADSRNFNADQRHLINAA